MKKEHQIIMLPSESGVIMSEVGAYDTDMVLITELPEHLRTSDRPHNHLYILSDEEIKEGDWFINLGSGGHPGVAIYKTNSENSKAINEFKFPEIKKIIATTDLTLNKLNNENKVDESWFRPIIPLIPQHIIEAYVKKPFDKVRVEYERQTNKGEWKDVLLPSEWGDSNPTRPKLNTDGTLAVSLVEEKMYSREEMIKFGRLCFRLKWDKENDDKIELILKDFLAKQKE